MGFFDDIFGGFFDFNGDGKTTWDEEWIAHKIIQDIEAETKRENSYNAPFYDDDEFESYIDELEEEFDEAVAANDESDWRLYADGNPYGIDPYDYETEDEYLEAIEERNEAGEWRLYVDENRYGINPNDYETQEEYQLAVDEADIAYIKHPFGVPITLDFSVEFPALDKLDAIKESDYPNKRTYNAAVRKVSLETGLIIGLNDKERTKEIERCDFILNNYNNCIAAKYLTTDYYQFLYTQAVKENFELPFDLPDEDENIETTIDDLFIRIHKESKEQLFPIWKWLVDNFVPYMQYSSDNGYGLSTGIIVNCSLVELDFVKVLADYIEKNKDFGKFIIELSPSLDNDYGTLFALLLKKHQIEYTKELFEICVKKNIDSAHINGVIFGLMEGCSNYKELETMELFEQHIFPLIKDIDKAAVKDIISSWENEIKDYYEYCEENCEQYQFTRKNAWRTKYVKQAEEIGYNIVNYDTEEEFLQDYNEEKYDWRNYYTTEDTHGLNPADFETEEALNEAVNKTISENDKLIKSERKQAKKANIARITQPNKKPMSYSNEETIELRKDKTIYTYVGVLFPYSTHHYHYITDDDSITIGNSVIVPVGADNKEMVAKVVSVEKHLRISAPFPVEKTKKIIRKNTVADSVPTKLRLISNNICFGPMPDADEEVEQHLTILSDGRMWISRYCFGHGGAEKFELIEKKQINIGKELAEEILTYTKNYFDEKGIIMQCTDVGVWELFLTDKNDFQTVILGSLITDEYTSEISKYLRKKLPVSHLFLFDGNIRK